MASNFYERYQNYDADKLINIVLNPDDFQAEAVETAKKIIYEKNWVDQLNQRQEENKKFEIIANSIEEEDIENKARYYADLVDFQHNGFFIQVRISDIPKLEGMLDEHGIKFLREDKNIGVQLDKYPTQTYYFRHEDMVVVDDITKKLELIAAPYADIKPFFSFELKATFISLIIILILYFLFQ